MKIKNSSEKYVDIQIKFGPSFEYKLPDNYEQFKNYFFQNGYSLSKGELSYLNSETQKIIIKSKNDFISLLRKVQESKTKIKLTYEKSLTDSLICDNDFIKIQNVYSDLNTDDESILELSQSINLNELKAINEDEDKEYYNNAINIIQNIFKKKYYLELIVKIKGKEFCDKKRDQKQLDKIPKNKICGSINLEYNLLSIDNLIKNSKISLVDKDDDILKNIYNHFEKMEEIRNNNSIYQTMLNNNSRLSLIKKEKEQINKDKNKIYETQIIQNSFYHECNNCHINPIKKKRYKCSKCINYNLCENCEEKNSLEFFHPHSNFILIRENKNNFSENPYSYQCLTKNLVFDIKEENIIDDKIIIKNILLKNNFILPWPGNNNTYIKCNKAISTIFCEKIFLPNLVLGNSVNIDFIFFKANKIPKGKYNCICNFYVNNIQYGEPLELFINLI